MATYKVIQDIEAEDKLIAWLSFRQFVYAGIVVFCGFIGYELGKVQIWLALPMLIPMLFFGLLASPLGQDQPTEVWLLAKIRFFLKPRRRVWDQSGVKQLVTVTAPKHIETPRTNNLTQIEVKSRLQALADTIDSRGWSIKNVSANTFATPSLVAAGAGSDRLIDLDSIPREVPAFDVGATEDMLDESTNPQAQHLTQMINASEQAHRQQVLSMMQNGGVPLPQPVAPVTATPGQQPPADYWFMNDQPSPTAAPPGYATFGNDPFIPPNSPTQMMPQQVPGQQANQGTSLDEETLLKHIHEEKARPNPMNSRLKTILPLEEQQRREAEERQRKARQAAEEAAKSAMTATPDPAILDLANNDDLNVATIAREADKRKGQLLDDGEVVISLH